MSYKISSFARRFGLSRSTLLYYDRIGLLSPSGRSEANYRLYSEADVKRMEKIDLYRRTGISLDAISRLLESEHSSLLPVLESRLKEIQAEIAALQDQQNVLARLARDEPDAPHNQPLDKKQWVEILRASGMSDDDMRRWHVEFERVAPESHMLFLQRLGIGADEITAIRLWSRQGDTN